MTQAQKPDAFAKALAERGLTLDPRDHAAALRVFDYLETCRRLVADAAPR